MIAKVRHGPASLPISHGDFKTTFEDVYENIKNIDRTIEKRYFGDAQREQIEYEAELLREVMAKVLSLLLYLCSEEPDYGDKKPPVYSVPQKVKGKEKWFAPAWVKDWDVGVRIGAAIRKYRVEQTESEVGISSGDRHTPKRPHIRRAHWHGFWQGKRTEVEQRKFILRWIPPTPVKIGGEDMPAVIRQIKKS